MAPNAVSYGQVIEYIQGQSVETKRSERNLQDALNASGDRSLTFSSHRPTLPSILHPRAQRKHPIPIPDRVQKIAVQEIFKITARV